MEERKHIRIRLASEVFTKSRRTRRKFLGILADNIRDALETHDLTPAIDIRWDRIEVDVSDFEKAVPVLQRVFGTGPICPVTVVTESNLEEIVAAGEEAFRDAVRDRQFAVRARRDKQQPFRSNDVEVKLGAALDQYADHVDLDDPDITVYVEVKGDYAYLFSERLDGGGGLPVGTENRAVSLVSGGYDSAVASWMALRRGVDLDYVFCNLAGKAYERAVLRVTKVLADEWSYGSQPRMFVLDFNGVVDEMKRTVDPSYWQVVLKRLMYRAAAQVMNDTQADAIITGESIGQVSSQTLKNLRAIDEITTHPVLRPVIGMDKQEIIDRARDIGTAALAENVKEYCALNAGGTVTEATLDNVDMQEARFDRDVLEEALTQVETHDLRALTPADLTTEYLFAEEVPDDAVVIDCQSDQGYMHWHYPGADHVTPDRLWDDYKNLDQDQTYILYCPRGVRTAYLAEAMQQDGYEAYSFKGGVRALQKHLEGQERSGAAAVEG